MVRSYFNGCVRRKYMASQAIDRKYLCTLVSERCFATPFILGYSNLLIRAARREQFAIITPLRIITMTCVCFIAWEWLAPLLVAGATYDICDLLAYSFGSGLYFIALVFCR